MEKPIGNSFIPRVGDVFCIGGSFYGKIEAVSKSGTSVKYATEYDRDRVSGWMRVYRVFVGGIGGHLVTRGHWTPYIGDPFCDLPPCHACESKPTRDTETHSLEYPCACLECARCGRAFKPDDPEAPRVAPSEELAAKHDRHDRGMCGLCWRYVTEMQR